MSQNEIVHAFAGKHVLIVGDVMLDEYVWGKVRRISPEAPVPVIEYESRSFRPGGAANAAANVRSLGGNVLMGSVVGADAQGRQLLELLQAGGMDSQGLFLAQERWTTTKTRLLAHHQQVVRIDYERIEALSDQREDELLTWVKNNIQRADACVLSDYAKGLVSVRIAEEVIRLARQAGKPVLVDPKGVNFAKYRGATLVKPNQHEVERVLNHEIRAEAELMDAGRRLLELLEGSAVLITRGAHGMNLFRADAPPVHFPSLARNVFDVTGAGDTVVGVVALALAAHVDLEAAAQLANKAAGIVVGKVGTAQVTRAELLADS